MLEVLAFLAITFTLLLAARPYFFPKKDNIALKGKDQESQSHGQKGMAESSPAAVVSACQSPDDAGLRAMPATEAKEQSPLTENPNEYFGNNRGVELSNLAMGTEPPTTGKQDSLSKVKPSESKEELINITHLPILSANQIPAEPPAHFSFASKAGNNCQKGDFEYQTTKAKSHATNDKPSEARKDLLKRGGRPPSISASETQIEPRSESPLRRRMYYIRKVGREWKLLKENGDEEFAEIDNLENQEPPYVFRLKRQTMKEGDLVKSASRGNYLVLVPAAWRRNEEIAGRPPIEPEQVSIPGYRAHYFFLEKGSAKRITFINEQGKEITVPSNEPQFELRGNRIADFDENRSPLFGEQAPWICAKTPSIWESVQKVIIGEMNVTDSENVKYGKRLEFKPNIGMSEQQLPPDFLDTQAGWYFIRFYDKDDLLIDSLDFRFFRALKDINFPKHQCFPSTDGHKLIQVEILHEHGCIIQPKETKDCRVQIESSDARTILGVPPHPDCDRTNWHIAGADGVGVDVTVLVERIWWAEGTENEVPSGWQDKPIVLRREDFRATSDKALWIRLPRERWTKEVHVGFEQARSRPYLVLVTEREVSIPLRDFNGSPELDQPGKHPFLLCIGNDTLGIASVEIKLNCRRCNFAVFTERELIRHAIGAHRDHLFTPADWRTYQNQDSNLPAAIYQCNVCNFYVRTNDRDNPTSAICQHFEKEHPGIVKSIRIINKAEEIREKVIRSLPRPCHCSICHDEKVVLSETDIDGLEDHLILHLQDISKTV